MGLGARMLHTKLADPSLHGTERAFIDELSPAFTELAETAEDTLYVDGAHRLVSEYRFQDVSQLNALMEMLERRVSMLGVLLVGARPRAARTCGSAARTPSRRCTRCRSWPRITGCRSAIWARCR